MNNHIKSYFHKSSRFGLTAVLVLGLSPASHSADLFQDGFQGGDLGNWTSVPGGEDVPEDQQWRVVPDPSVANAKHNVLCTPDKATQTYLYHVEPQTVRGLGLSLSFRFNADEANREWNTQWTLFTDAVPNGSYLVEGYGVRFGFNEDASALTTTVSINRVDPQGGLGARVDLATATLPDDLFLPGWNEVRFLWKMDGTLKMLLNGKEVVSAKDNKYEPAFRSLSNATFLSNNLKIPESLPEGRKLYFDKIKVDDSD